MINSKHLSSKSRSRGVSVPKLSKAAKNGGAIAEAGSPTNAVPDVANVAVIGLGYVGLPLALQFARSGTHVTGIDIDPSKTHALNRGRSYIKHVASSEVKQQVVGGKFSASTDFSEIRNVDAVVICVPTPLNKNREPDISYIINTGKAIAPYLQRGVVVVLESTTYPGTTDEDLRAVLESGSGLRAGVDFHLAFSPEREDPGNESSKVADIPKVIGGLTPTCLEKAMAIYQKAIKRLVPVSSCRAAESTKLLENIFRAVNIALVNELKIVYGAMNIDVWEVIDAAKTKPFGFMPFYPGPGLGGHCIPIDPFYLTWKSREYGQNTKFIELAGEVNTAMPNYVVSRVTEALNHRRKPLNGSRILLLGLAYKAEVDDMRESPTFVLMDLLTNAGAKVDYFDPYIPVIKPTREHSHRTGMKSISWDRKTIASYDAVLISTAHKEVNYAELGKWASLIVDTRNAMAKIECRPKQVWKA